ncbi:hypothetical protein D3C86_1915420 [compost metagenome]
MADAPASKEIQGKSFFDLLKNDKVSWRNRIYYHYYEYPQPHRVMPHFGIRTKKFKLIRFYGEQDFWELYDLEKDPQELSNIYSEFENSELLIALKKDLAISIKEYKDDLAAEIMSK